MAYDTKSTRRRLFTAEQMAAARATWDAGAPWSPEWRDWRHLAATEAGIIAAPEGDAYDSWGDDHPSQRAMLVRAIRETPDMLRSAIREVGRSRYREPGWHDVIEVLLADRDRTARDDDEHLSRERRYRQEHEADARQATYALRTILDIIRDS